MSAWYLKISAAPDTAVLVGDRGRALRAADLLDDAVVLNEDRGLTTVVGSWHGAEVVVSAFGMGAPIAAIVMHELAALGTTTFVRAGTMMSTGVALGTFIVADRALIAEGTSAAYGYREPSIELAREFGDVLAAVCTPAPVVRGTVATSDGFYTHMTDLLGPLPLDLWDEWEREGVIGFDMETSALASVARHLGVSFGSLCLATVDRDGPVMLALKPRQAGEIQLMESALSAAVQFRNDQKGTPP